jgi:preprotein translocase subunit YajC
MNLMQIFLMAPPAEGQSGIMQLLPFLAIIVVFYFFMIRPQMKRQKEMNNFRSGLQKGDKVVTTGGIYGRIVEVKENYVNLEIAKEVTIKVDKAGLVKDPSDLQQQQQRR